MLNTVKVDLNREELIKAIKAMKKKEREAFLEDLLAATSPVYLESIREARADYKSGKTKTHKEVFGG
jgi:PHD/YefM family antitoxin component YafN of YafNO toxin-antitoxin module